MIKQLHIHQFGGIYNQKVDFQKGLNVIFGPNESGKSTLVEALFALFFIDAKLNRKEKQAKEFMMYAFPYEKSDYAEACVCFEFQDHHYELYKLWHLDKPVFEIKKDQQKIINEKQKQTLLDEYLKFGQGTYEHTVFAKQDVFKNIFTQIRNDDEVIHTLDQLLQKASMELDGLSVELFRKRLDQEYNALAGNWDMETQRPKKNRMWNHPHKQNVGAILFDHYQKTKAQDLKNKVVSLESQMETLQSQINKEKKQLTTIIDQLDRLLPLQGEIVKRNDLENQLENRQEKLDTLKKVNQKWPVLEVQCEQDQKRLAQLEAQIQKLDQTLTVSKAVEKLQSQWSKLEEKKQLQNALSEVEKQRKPYAAYNEKTIKQLEQLDKDINGYQIQLASAQLEITVNKAGDTLVVTDLDGHNKMLETSDTHITQGYMHITQGDHLSLEIKSKQIPLDQVHQNLAQKQKQKENVLDRLSVDSVEKAKINLQSMYRLEERKNHLQEQLVPLPDEQSAQEIEKQKKQLQAQSPGNIEELEHEKAKQMEEKTQLAIGYATRKEKISEWKEQYGSLDESILALGKRSYQMDQIKEQIQNLASLPKGYDSVEDCLSAIKKMQIEKERIQSHIHDLQADHQDLVYQLPEESLEELDEVIQSADISFVNNLKKAQQIQTIQRVFEETITSIKTSSISPLEAAFANHIGFLTQNHYQTIDIKNPSEVKLVHNDYVLPTQLLSSGTLDGVVLAFRLAYMEQLAKEGVSFFVLDDCLVNMDQQRQPKAIEMIQNHAQKQQVIFTTCHESIAGSLKGHSITL